ncbi:hypothetical protein P153DRAFT_391165 [Dothidotthia symphoricarpi CBS 119687]|uniref:Uncharacterized protein n=1 Tax=Dothidotthia symphoricarpi CBS 119687 TaxID=1392245 RepID=A0A6A5ZW41_9PLEO|nr:uncharacterized protein P153DRAFT_391165 [Dothidotthia symphoricarpi CBS 119687]KAF2123749.1 hypothetical protein P153DRAFT_391165 [Dothidotthia symphoricarpi CBS 119687]
MAPVSSGSGQNTRGLRSSRRFLGQHGSRSSPRFSGQEPMLGIPMTSRASRRSRNQTPSPSESAAKLFTQAPIDSNSAPTPYRRRSTQNVSARKTVSSTTSMPPQSPSKTKRTMARANSYPSLRQLPLSRLSDIAEDEPISDSMDSAKPTIGDMALQGRVESPVRHNHSKERRNTSDADDDMTETSNEILSSIETGDPSNSPVFGPKAVIEAPAESSRRHLYKPPAFLDKALHSAKSGQRTLTPMDKIVRRKLRREPRSHARRKEKSHHASGTGRSAGHRAATTPSSNVATSYEHTDVPNPPAQPALTPSSCQSMLVPTPRSRSPTPGPSRVKPNKRQRTDYESESIEEPPTYKGKGKAALSQNTDEYKAALYTVRCKVAEQESTIANQKYIITSKSDLLAVTEEARIRERTEHERYQNNTQNLVQFLESQLASATSQLTTNFAHYQEQLKVHQDQLQTCQVEITRGTLESASMQENHQQQMKQADKMYQDLLKQLEVETSLRARAVEAMNRQADAQVMERNVSQYSMAPPPSPRPDPQPQPQPQPRLEQLPKHGRFTGGSNEDAYRRVGANLDGGRDQSPSAQVPGSWPTVPVPGRSSVQSNVTAREDSDPHFDPNLDQNDPSDSNRNHGQDRQPSQAAGHGTDHGSNLNVNQGQDCVSVSETGHKQVGNSEVHTGRQENCPSNPDVVLEQVYPSTNREPGHLSISETGCSQDAPSKPHTSRQQDDEDTLAVDSSSRSPTHKVSSTPHQVPPSSPRVSSLPKQTADMSSTSTPPTAQRGQTSSMEEKNEQSIAQNISTLSPEHTEDVIFASSSTVVQRDLTSSAREIGLNSLPPSGLENQQDVSSSLLPSLQLNTPINAADLPERAVRFESNQTESRTRRDMSGTHPDFPRVSKPATVAQTRVLPSSDASQAEVHASPLPSSESVNNSLLPPKSIVQTIERSVMPSSSRGEKAVPVPAVHEDTVMSMHDSPGATMSVNPVPAPGVDIREGELSIESIIRMTMGLDLGDHF